MSKRFALFCVAGATGFAVDLITSLLFIKILNWDALLARVLAWTFAVVSTFVINSLLAFSKGRLDRSSQTPVMLIFLEYCLTQALGGCLNIAIFYCLVMVSKAPILVGILFGTVSGLIINYLGARKVLRG